jgi:hypothetical protein
MGLCYLSIVTMLMMLIVNVAMLMLENVVLVLVFMPLGKV